MGDKERYKWTRKKKRRRGREGTRKERGDEERHEETRKERGEKTVENRQGDMVGKWR